MTFGRRKHQQQHQPQAVSPPRPPSTSFLLAPSQCCSTTSLSSIESSTPSSASSSTSSPTDGVDGSGSESMASSWSSSNDRGASASAGAYPYLDHEATPTQDYPPHTTTGEGADDWSSTIGRKDVSYFPRQDVHPPPPPPSSFHLGHHASRASISTQMTSSSSASTRSSVSSTCSISTPLSPPVGYPTSLPSSNNSSALEMDQDSVAIETTEGSYTVVARLPGFSLDSITLATKKKTTLHIVADKWMSDGGSHFERKISFGQDAEMADIKAQFDGDVLRVTVPRLTSQPAPPPQPRPSHLPASWAYRSSAPLPDKASPTAGGGDGRPASAHEMSWLYAYNHDGQQQQPPQREPVVRTNSDESSGSERMV